MATAMPQDNTPSLRGARDKYLALLLSAGQPNVNPSQSSAIPPIVPTTKPSAPMQSSSVNESWTPGQKFPGVPPTWNSAQPWTSPVTPTPTEGDVRLAEMAAGLVAAGGMERRQADTIRQLSGELERSEKRVEQLTRARRDIRDGFEHAIRTSSHEKARKSIHFQPRVSRRESFAGRGYDFDQDIVSNDPERNLTRRMSERIVPDRRSLSRRASERRISSRQSLNSREKEKLKELENLRRERNQWLMAQEKSEKDAASLSNMIANIKKNTKRLIVERDDHLKVIARLQDEVGECKQSDVRRFSAIEEHVVTKESSPDPRSRHHSYISQRDSRRRSMRNYQPMAPVEEYEEEHYESASVSSLQMQGAVHEHSLQHGVKQEFSRERELAKELQVVLEENARLTGRIPQLEAHCQDLSSRLEQTERKQSVVQHAQENRPRQIDDNEVLDALCGVLDEMDILEAVAGAVKFKIDPTEVDQLQETFTQLDLDHTRPTVRQEKYRKESSETCPVASLKKLTNRLEQVRNGLAVSYGQWLQDVGEDAQTSTLDDTSVLLEGSNDKTEELPTTMNTKVIENLIAEN